MCGADRTEGRKMKIYSVKENHLFSKAYAKGKKVGCRNVAVYLLKDTHASLLRKQNPQKKYLNRVGLTVSKRVGGAVQRNRAKRVIREAYRQADKNYILKKGFIIIIVARESAAGVKTAQIYSDLVYAFGKLGIIEDGGKS